MKLKFKLRGVLRQRVFVLGVFISIMFAGLTAVFYFSNIERVYGAPANGDFRSNGSGNWNNIAIWQKYNGSVWVAATAFPDNGDKVITIQSGHTVTITAALSVDQVIVEAGGVLALNSGITLSLKKTTAPDMHVFGIFRNAGTVSITAGTNITYENGGVYQHNYTTTAGTIPVGVWNTGSICEMYGYTTNTGMPSGLNQSFADFKWNCTSQITNVNFGGGLTSFTGNFIIASTGTGELQLASNNYTFNLNGDYIQTGGICNLNTGVSKNIVFNVSGNLQLSGGTFNLTSGITSSANLNLTGNWSHTGGVLTVGGASSTGQVNFTNTSAKTFTASGNTVSGQLDYVINSGAIVNMGNNVMLGRNFTLASGGELGIGAAEGVSSSGPVGNIQVSGTRTFNAGGYYTYNGSGNQVTGNGLPSTINTLKIDNGNFLSLTNNVSVSNVLNLTSGKIQTNSFELHVTNTSAGAITGNSNNSYVVGNLRRTVSGNCTVAFPLGSLTLYELMTISTSGLAGTTSMLGNFVEGNTNDTLYPLEINVNGVDITEMLNYGYWTLTPNSALTGGSYSVELKEQGYSNMATATTYFSLLSRPNSNSSWQSVGIHNDNTQSLSGGVVTAKRTALTGFFQFGIGLGDLVSFSSPTLISGSAGQVGAIYKFINVMRGVDAWITITNLFNGATLNDIDNAASGYDESFQPFVNFPANKDSYIEWEVRFKKAGTSTDTTVKKFTATGVDVDGSSSIREYVVATMPTSYSLDSATVLTMSNDSGRYKALSSTATISNIDTSHHEAMYQLNYNNVNTLLYRTGAVNTSASSQTRQTSLYFRSFLLGSPVYALPIKLIEFNARLKEKKVLLSWSTAAEINNDYFTVERSSDGRTFKPLFTKRGAGNSTTLRNYEMVDENPLHGQAYYRLKQTDYDGKFSYSKVRSVVSKKSQVGNSLTIISVSPNPFSNKVFVRFSSRSAGKTTLALLDASGKLLRIKDYYSQPGENSFEWEMNNELLMGIYLIVIDKDGERVSKKLVRD